MLSLMIKFQKNKENRKDKDWNVPISKNQRVKWNIINIGTKMKTPPLYKEQ